jgi:hypothetical protein
VKNKAEGVSLLSAIFANSNGYYSATTTVKLRREKKLTRHLLEPSCAVNAVTAANANTFNQVSANWIVAGDAQLVLRLFVA